MQNKYFKFFIIALAVIIIVPQVALAAWWNPMSWGIWNSIFHFQKTEQKQEQQVQKVDTKDWKTYTNSQYGFEFKYPNYKINDLTATDDASILLRFSFSNYLFDVTKKDSIQGIDYDSTHAPYKTKTKVIRGSILVNGIKWDTLQVDYSPKVSGIGSNLRFSMNKNDVRYAFSCYDCNTDKNKNEIFNQIIFTFKFTDNSPIVGGDKDVHGCIGSAGYSWCETKKKCLRQWEERCDTMSDWEKYTNDQLMTMANADWKNQAMYYEGLEGNLLIIDQGTAPDPRGLIIYDLKNKKQVFSDRYSKPLDITNATVSYWNPIAQKVTVQNCPDSVGWFKEGLGAEIESHVSLDLTTFTKKDLEQTRCRPVQ